MNAGNSPPRELLKPAADVVLPIRMRRCLRDGVNQCGRVVDQDARGLTRGASPNHSAIGIRGSAGDLGQSQHLGVNPYGVLVDPREPYWMVPAHVVELLGYRKVRRAPISLIPATAEYPASLRSGMSSLGDLG